MSRIVLKFGGSSQCMEGYETIKSEIVKNKTKNSIIIIVSAIQNTTNLLYKIINKHEDTYDKILALHLDICNKLNIKCDKIVKLFDNLLNDIKELNSNPLIDITQQKIKILSYGEIIASNILSLYIKDSVILNAREFIKSLNDCNSIDTSNFNQMGKFYCDEKALNYIIKENGIYITQGFIASTKDDKFCILTRSGSDTSASLIANAINAKYLEIWTDVDGMFTADPRYIKDASIIDVLDYDISQELAGWGTKVIHPFCIKPCKDKNIPIHIRNTFNPKSKINTLITNHTSDNKIYSIVNQENNTVYYINTKHMWNNTGFASAIFKVFAENKIDINIITTDNFSISLTTNETLEKKLLGAYEILKKSYNVKMIMNCSIVSIVADNITDNDNIYGAMKIIKGIGEEHLHITHYNTNNLSVSYVMDSCIADKVTRLFHRQFIISKIERINNDKIWWRKINNLEKYIGNNKSVYIYNKTDIINKCKKIKSLKAIDEVYYAMKANSNKEVIKTIISHDIGLECVSLEEIKYVRSFYTGQILFTPNYCHIEEYMEALKDESILVVIDNYQLILNYPYIFRNKNIGIRLDIDNGDGHNEKVVTEGNNVKFGMPLSEIEILVKNCSNINTKIVMLHSHSGSGILNYKSWINTYEKLYKLLKYFPNVETLNLGGGLGIFTSGKELNIELLNSELIKIKKKGIRIVIEPGRYLVAESGIILTKATQKREKGKYKYLGVDSGMNVIIRPMLYGSYHPIYNLSKIEYKHDTEVNIVGPICESGDIVGKNILMPWEKTETDDVILIENTGAYVRTMASEYNMRKLPNEIIIK